MISTRNVSERVGSCLQVENASCTLSEWSSWPQRVEFKLSVHANDFANMMYAGMALDGGAAL